MKKSYREIASNWSLWCEYIDTSAAFTKTEADFLAICFEDRLYMIEECFGKEVENDNNDE